ncbi:MAG: hypothetical protein E5V85_07860 [Mesorhizobium sp.]|nr:MAG: hypothetical protein E5V85_07860 [Mesorhizobium sp.]
MADRPELAVVVIGFRAPTDLVAAVRSVLGQNIPLEVVVVNSGAVLEAIPPGRDYFPAHTDDGGLWMADVSADRQG